MPDPELRRRCGRDDLRPCGRRGRGPPRPRGSSSPLRRGQPPVPPPASGRQAWRARPLIRFSSARARSGPERGTDHLRRRRALPRSVARASRRRLTRRCAAPSASSVRRAIEWEFHLRVPRECLSRTQLSAAIEIACLRRQQPSAARLVGEGRDYVRADVRFPRTSQQLHRLVASAELDRAPRRSRRRSGCARLDDRLSRTNASSDRDGDRLVRSPRASSSWPSADDATSSDVPVRPQSARKRDRAASSACSSGRAARGRGSGKRGCTRLEKLLP